MDLRKKTVSELRTIAQAFGVSEIYKLDAKGLIYEIERRQAASIEPVVELPPRREYDSRTMTKAPARKTDANEVLDYLGEHIRRGLRVRFDDERWYMSCGMRTDEGTLRMPVRHVINCADRVLRGK